LKKESKKIEKPKKVLDKFCFLCYTKIEMTRKKFIDVMLKPSAVILNGVKNLVFLSVNNSEIFGGGA